jgi:hypothetical protein
MSAGVDYAFSPHPSIAALTGAKVVFVCRYISTLPANDANGKNLTPGECKALLGAGIKIVVVAEEGASMMLGGYAAGKAAAVHADAVVKALGMPGIPVYFAADFDATPAQQTPVNAFLDGAASVIGQERTGIYGGFYVVRRALDAETAAYAWQTLAWSGGQWDRRAQLRQGLSFTLGGASVDHDTAIDTHDYGQWPRPAPAPAAGLHKHLTVEGDTLGTLAAARGQSPEQFVAWQRQLGTKIHPLVSGPLPAGAEWQSVAP